MKFERGNFIMINGKIIVDILPVSGEMASSFCCCLSSVLLSKGIKTKYDKKFASYNIDEQLRRTYTQALTASGLGFSYIFKTDFSTRFDKREYYKAFDNDEYIKYALNYGRCNYRIIKSDDVNMKSEIISSIERNMPVIAEGLSDSTWCLITGYEDKAEKLYGYTSGCWCCVDCVDCINRNVDGRLDNNMFYKLNWEQSMKRIVIIDDFNAERFDYKTYIKHWISVMQQKSQNGFFFGQEAYDANIKFLEDDTNFHNNDDNTLNEIYRFIYTNCFIPEYGIFSNWGLLGALQVPDNLLKDKETGLHTDLHSKLIIIMKNGLLQHNIGWNFYAALSDKKIWQANAKQYANTLKITRIRKKAITQLKKLKEIDLITLNTLISILN